MPDDEQPEAKPELKVNVGCGDYPIEGWVNVDVDEDAGAVAREKKWQFRVAPAHDLDWLHDGSVSILYCSHVLEHYLPEFVGDIVDHVGVVLDEFWRVLVDGGELLVAVPDTLEICSRVRSEEGHRDDWLRMLYGHHAKRGDDHFWGYTAASLGALLGRHGFEPCGTFEPFVRNPKGEGMDCAGAWAGDDYGNCIDCSLNVRARRVER